MKRLFVVLMAFAAFQAQAQTGESRLDSRSTDNAPTSKFELVPVGGLGAVALKGDISSEWSTDVAGSIGGLFELGSGYTTLQTGVLYSLYSMKTKFETVFGDIEGKIRWDYLSIPVIGKVNFMGNANRTVYLKVGAMPSWITNKSVELKYLGTTNTDKDIPLKTFDVLAVGGIGGAIAVAKNKAVIVEATYIRGLTNIAGNSGNKLYNEGFMVYGGFSFGI